VLYVPVLSNTVEPIWSILSLDAIIQHKGYCSLVNHSNYNYAQNITKINLKTEDVFGVCKMWKFWGRRNGVETPVFSQFFGALPNFPGRVNLRALPTKYKLF